MNYRKRTINLSKMRKNKKGGQNGRAAGVNVKQDVFDLAKIDEYREDNRLEVKKPMAEL